MWADKGNDATRGEALYKRALTYLPEFVTANAHLAMLEAARGDTVSSIARLERVVASSNDPEAIALLGTLHVQAGDAVSGRQEISLARQRYESLLGLYPLGFADHGAVFYLGPGADPERAWVLAQQNLANRETDRAVALAIRAAEASSHYSEACALLKKYPDSVKSVQLQIWSPDPRSGPSVRPPGGQDAFDPRHNN
jgi:hypothetical protein